MSKFIVITSGKGGVGKTTTAINLGAALNHFGKDVLVIDANLSTPNVGIHLNSPEVPVCLNDVLLKEAEANEAVYQHESGLKIMPASLSIKELKSIKPENLIKLKKDIEKLSDVIILDSAAGLSSDTLSVIKMADELIVVTNPEMPAITDALKTIKLAQQMKIPIKGIIVTRVRKDRLEMEPEVVKDMLESPVLGMIPEDLVIKQSLNLKDAIVHTHPKSSPARAYKEIAAQLINHDYDSTRDRPSFLRRLLGKDY